MDSSEEIEKISVKAVFTCFIGNLIVRTVSATVAADGLALQDNFSESRHTTLTAHRLRYLRKMIENLCKSCGFMKK